MKIFHGLIVSLKNKNTAVVRVESLKVHNKYKKVVKTFKNFQVHYDNDFPVEINKRVIIKQSRPFSVTKRFIMVGTEN